MWKKIAKTLLFPHIAVLILLLPISAVSLIGSMVFIGTESVVAIISYVISAYTLTALCIRIPDIIKFIKNVKNENKYVRRWGEDARLRVSVSLYGSLIFNTLYGIFHLWLGFYHKTLWFGSLGAYYISLAFMRFVLLRHTRKYLPGEMMHTELIKYRATGWIFLLMNAAISTMIFFMVYFDKTFVHHEITTIAIAAYTFTSLTLAIISIIKYRKYNSPVYSASKAISLASACVSMITLEATMLTAFGKDTMEPILQKILLSLSGGAVSLFIILIAVGMVVSSTNKLKSEVKNGEQ